MMETLTIGTMAKRTGVKAVTIRYYESIGLLPKPVRTRGNFRSYSVAHCERLGFIRKARALGFALPEVRTLLSLASDNRKKCEDVYRVALEHLNEVERKLAELRALRRELRALMRTCQGGAISDCKIIGALSSRIA